MFLPLWKETGCWMHRSPEFRLLESCIADWAMCEQQDLSHGPGGSEAEGQGADRPGI